MHVVHLPAVPLDVCSLYIYWYISNISSFYWRSSQPISFSFVFSPVT
jgi:hypothetical protein